MENETLIVALTGAFTTLLAYLLKVNVSQRKEIRRLHAALLKQAQKGDLSTDDIDDLKDDTHPD